MRKTNPNAGGSKPELPDVRHFLTTILEIRRNANSTLPRRIPAQLVARLAGLAQVAANHELFDLAIEWAVRDAQESLGLSAPAYKGQFIEQLEQLNQAALHLERQIEKFCALPIEKHCWSKNRYLTF
jgi:hypothetical protein